MSNSEYSPSESPLQGPVLRGESWQIGADCGKVRHSGGYSILQIFNQYSEIGGEEFWVDQIHQLGGAFKVGELRFRSSAWLGRDYLTSICRVGWLWRNPYAIQRLRDEIAWFRPDVILLHNDLPVGSMALVGEAARMGIPVIRYIHNFRPFSPSGTLWVNGRVNDASLRGNVWPEILSGSWEKSISKTCLLALCQRRWICHGGLDQVSHWIAVSNFMRDKFISAGIPADKITTLRHCWRASPRASSEFISEGEGDYYLFLGRLVAEKGIYALIDAWNILVCRGVENVPRLYIAGVGPDQELITKMIETNPRVNYIGFVSGERKTELIKGCRGLIAPSIWWEPLGLIVYEAYEHLRPVVAARSGGLMETVLDGVTGLLHEPGCAESLADSVLAMEQAGAVKRHEMGAEGRRWLEAHACPDRWVETFLEIVTKAVNSNS